MIMNMVLVLQNFINDFNTQSFLFYIPTADSECNRSSRKIDYSCKSHTLREALILLINVQSRRHIR